MVKKFLLLNLLTFRNIIMRRPSVSHHRPSSRPATEIESRRILAPFQCDSCSSSVSLCYISSYSVRCSRCVQLNPPCSLTLDISRVASLIELQQIDLQILSVEAAVLHDTREITRIQADLSSLLANHAEVHTRLSSLLQDL